MSTCVLQKRGFSGPQTWITGKTRGVGPTFYSQHFFQSKEQYLVVEIRTSMQTYSSTQSPNPIELGIPLMLTLLLVLSISFESDDISRPNQQCDAKFELPLFALATA